MKLISFFAQGGPVVPWTDTSKWLFGLMGFLGCIWLVFAVVIQCKKLFSRVPPVNETLNLQEKRLRGEMAHQKNSVLKEMRQVLEPLIQRLEKNESAIEDIQADRIRKWDALQREINGVQQDLAFIRGKFERGES
mgnify:CR=1 FL=1